MRLLREQEPKPEPHRRGLPLVGLPFVLADFHDWHPNIVIGVLVARQLQDRRGYIINLRQDLILELWCVSHKRIERGYSSHGAVQVLE